MIKKLNSKPFAEFSPAFVNQLKTHSERNAAAMHIEIGLNKCAGASRVAASNPCFELVDLYFPLSEESSYMGCLLFDDEIFCCQIAQACH